MSINKLMINRICTRFHEILFRFLPFKCTKKEFTDCKFTFPTDKFNQTNNTQKLGIVHAY